ncbi:YdeI/OmpD-associated family protein [Alloscardovia criceti]|uniref:YdeI/OmpD-associated family protein n=1 Tax=Alloscardovia criceti TaxID=356828 RepID=UPI0003650E67
MGSRNFKIDAELEAALKQARVWSKFRQFPPLYQRVRAYNVSFYKKKNPETYRKSLERLMQETQKEHMYGEWNGYVRLLDY